jgi:hypothetical protein
MDHEEYSRSLKTEDSKSAQRIRNPIFIVNAPEIMISNNETR